MPYVPLRDRERIKAIIQRVNVPIAETLGLAPLNLATLKVFIDRLPSHWGYTAFYRPGAKDNATLHFDRKGLKDYYDYGNANEMLEKLVIHEMTHAIVGQNSRPSGTELYSAFNEGLAEWTALTLSEGWWMFGAGAEGKVESVHASPVQRRAFRPLRDKYGSMALFLQTREQQHPGLIREVAKTMNTRYGDLPRTFENYTGEPLRESVRRFRNPTPATPERRERKARTAHLVREGL